MKKYLILLFAVLFSNQTDIDLKEFQSGKIKQLSGNLYSYYVPRKEVNIRLDKIENSEKVGTISKDNYSNYYIVDADEIWLSIYSEKDRKLIGYSRKYVDLWDDQIRKLFDRYSFIKTSSKVIVDNTVFYFDLIRCLDGKVGKWDMSGRYYYEISYIDDNQRIKLFSNGDERYFINSGLSVYIDKTIASDSQAVKDSDLYVLRFDNEIFGWMFATSKGGWYSQFDFTNSWVFIPKADGFLYKKHTYALKLTQIGEYLKTKDNQIDIIMMKDATGIQTCGACTGWDYFPEILRIQKNNKDSKKAFMNENNMSTEEFEAMEEYAAENYGSYWFDNVQILDNVRIEITQEFIESDPSYAFAIAFIANDKKSMRKAYELIKEELLIRLEKCDKYYKPLDDYISYDFQNQVGKDVVNLEEYWQSFTAADGYFQIQHSEAYEYLLECTGLDEKESSLDFYDLFYRTGLYPDPRLIEQYLESEYPAYPYPVDF